MRLPPNPWEVPVPTSWVRCSATWRPGDRVRLVPVPAADLGVGDVVLRADAAGLLTKGDGALRLDPPPPAGDVVARVVARMRDDRVRRLDGGGARILERCGAEVSLAIGLTVEAGDRCAWTWATSPEIHPLPGKRPPGV